MISDKYTLTRQHCRKKSDDTAGKSSLLRSWGDKDPLKRPACALLVTLAQAILHHADAHTLTTVVSSRQGGCLHDLSHTHTHTYIPYFLVVKQIVGSFACNSQSVIPLVLQYCSSKKKNAFGYRHFDIQKCTVAAWLQLCMLFVIQTLSVIAASCSHRPCCSCVCNCPLCLYVGWE